jgi:hypothetical protein
LRGVKRDPGAWRRRGGEAPQVGPSLFFARIHGQSADAPSVARVSAEWKRRRAAIDYKQRDSEPGYHEEETECRPSVEMRGLGATAYARCCFR